MSTAPGGLSLSRTNCLLVTGDMPSILLLPRILGGSPEHILCFPVSLCAPVCTYIHVYMCACTKEVPFSFPLPLPLHLFLFQEKWIPLPFPPHLSSKPIFLAYLCAKHSKENFWALGGYLRRGCYFTHLAIREDLRGPDKVCESCKKHLFQMHIQLDLWQCRS